MPEDEITTWLGGEGFLSQLSLFCDENPLDPLNPDGKFFGNVGGAYPGCVRLKTDEDSEEFITRSTTDLLCDADDEDEEEEEEEEK